MKSIQNKIICKLASSVLLIHYVHPHKLEFVLSSNLFNKKYRISKTIENIKVLMIIFISRKNYAEYKK